MRSLGLILLVVVVANAQHNYDGRNGPHVIGPPGQQVYIRGQNEGPYQVNGVGGTFQNSPNRGEHVFTDEQGNTFVHRKKGQGEPGTHIVSGPTLTAVRGPPSPPSSIYSGQQPGLQDRHAYKTDLPPGSNPALFRHSRSPDYVVSRPDRVVVSGGGNYDISRSRRSPDYVVSRPDRVVVSGGGNYDISRTRRSPDYVVSRPDRVVVAGGGNYDITRTRRSPDYVVSRPDRVVVSGGGNYDISRTRRSPDYVVSRPDRVVVSGGGNYDISRSRRSPDYVVSRPDRVVVSGGGNYDVSRSRRDTFQVSRPDRTVVFKTDRRRRSPQLITGPDGRYVDHREDSWTAVRADGRSVKFNSRQRRDISDARVQGENFVARDDQAGVWNDQVSVWRRPDGRTVTLDANGNAITSGRGRAPQHYSG